MTMRSKVKPKLIGLLAMLVAIGAAFAGCAEQGEEAQDDDIELEDVNEPGESDGEVTDEDVDDPTEAGEPDEFPDEGEGGLGNDTEDPGLNDTNDSDLGS